MISFENKRFILKLPKKLDHNSIYEIKVLDEPLKHLIFDFQETSSVTLSGILYIVCLSGYLNEIAKTKEEKAFYCEIINLKEYLINFLMNFGFFQQMNSKGNLYRVNNIDIMLDRKLLENEKKFVNHQFEKRNSNQNGASIIMPISTIVSGDKRFFESYVGNFSNKFYDFYMKLIDLGFFSISFKNEDEIREEFSEFTKAIFEVIKNIYDHSNSWGLGAIHARNKGVEIAYYDIGDGIAKSMKSSQQYMDVSDFEAITFAFKDGVSSKIDNGDNKGRGFTKILNFAQKRKGYLSVRTGSYHFVNGINKYINWFPGTQIVIFVPN